MKFINLTPHTINMNDGREFKPEGLARVSASFTDPDSDGICKQVFGEVEGLPAQKDGVSLIVSLLVLGASNRTGLVAPASGHPDTVRNEKGFIVSVPCFVQG